MAEGQVPIIVNAETARALSRVTWQEMMRGDIGAWLTFFRMIEDGCALQMISENSVTYQRKPAEASNG